MSSRDAVRTVVCQVCQKKTIGRLRKGTLYCSISCANRARPKTRFCPQGHDKDVVGRSIRNQCKACILYNNRHKNISPETRAKKRAREASPEYRARERARRLADPDRLAKQRAREQRRLADPVLRERDRARHAEYRNRPEVRARNRERGRLRRASAGPEVRARRNARDRATRAIPENRERMRLKYVRWAAIPENRERMRLNSIRNRRTLEYSRYQMLVEGPRELARAHNVAQEKLEAIFAEVNEVLVG